MNIHTEQKDITFLLAGRNRKGKTDHRPCWKFHIPHYTTVQHLDYTKLFNVVYFSVWTMKNVGCGYGIKNKDVVINK